MAEFNQLVGEFCVQREYTPPQPLPGFPNNPPSARQEAYNILVVDLVEKILMPTKSLVVHEKISREDAVAPEIVTVRADSLPNGYAYLVVKVLQTDTFVDVGYTDANGAPGTSRLGSTQMLAYPLIQSARITISLQIGNSNVDVLLIGSEDAIVP